MNSGLSGNVQRVELPLILRLHEQRSRGGSSNCCSQSQTHCRGRFCEDLDFFFFFFLPSQCSLRTAFVCALLCVYAREFAFIYEQVFVYRCSCVVSSADIELLTLTMWPVHCVETRCLYFYRAAFLNESQTLLFVCLERAKLPEPYVPCLPDRFRSAETELSDWTMSMTF